MKVSKRFAVAVTGLGVAAALIGGGVASADPGPVLTNKRETVARVMRALSGGGTGVMPTFIGVLTTKQINDVVAFVVAASKPGATVK